MRQTALRRFSAWLSEEGEAEADLLHDMKPVTLDKPVVPRLDDGEMARMVAACKGRTFLDVRDMALLRLMTEGLLRASEALSLRVEDVDLTRGIALVRRGKGGRGRLVPFGDETSAALDRYIRARRKHPLAFKPDLWLPASGQTFSYPGLASAKPSRPRSPDGSGRS